MEEAEGRGEPSGLWRRQRGGGPVGRGASGLWGRQRGGGGQWAVQEAEGRGGQWAAEEAEGRGAQWAVGEAEGCAQGSCVTGALSRDSAVG